MSLPTALICCFTLSKWYAWLCQLIRVFRARLSRVSPCRQRSAASRWISARRVDARSDIDPETCSAARGSAVVNCAEPEATPVMRRRSPPRAVIFRGELCRILDSSLAFQGRAERRFFSTVARSQVTVAGSATLGHPPGRVILICDFVGCAALIARGGLYRLEGMSPRIAVR